MIREISRIGLPENASYIGNLRKVDMFVLPELSHYKTPGKEIGDLLQMIYQIDILHKTLSSPVCVFFFR